MDKRIKNRCMDRGKYPFVIPDNYGEGIMGKKYYTDVAQKPREVYLRISTFRGLCWDAQHYYGKLYAFGAPIKEIGGDPQYSCCGYLGEDQALFKDVSIDIELWREVTERERKSNWNRYGTHDMTSGWCDKDALISFGKKVFAARFSGNWKLKIEDLTK